jgi:hypothetical protein
VAASQHDSGNIESIHREAPLPTEVGITLLNLSRHEAVACPGGIAPERPKGRRLRTDAELTAVRVLADLQRDYRRDDDSPRLHDDHEGSARIVAALAALSCSAILPFADVSLVVPAFVTTAALAYRIRASRCRRARHRP